MLVFPNTTFSLPKNCASTWSLDQLLKSRRSDGWVIVTSRFVSEMLNLSAGWLPLLKISSEVLKAPQKTVVGKSLVQPEPVLYFLIVCIQVPFIMIGIFCFSHHWALFISPWPRRL